MNDLKAIAIYLPQYHKVKENDEWWGEGFTEWTSVRQAEAYYEEHHQPRIPLNENYYDLDKKETMEWQAGLAEQYGIYGFCFYHYYFKEGRKILEKPAENLLKWTDIPLKYCFSWANMPWQRTWSNFSLGGSWASKFEKYEENSNPVLLEQDYGDEKEWKAHFDYLLPFFKDERYIKIDNKPVFLFHAVKDIGCLNQMVDLWRKFALDAGLEGLYLIGVVQDDYEAYPVLDALYAQEPSASITDYVQDGEEDKKDICARYYIYEDMCRWGYLKHYEPDRKVFFSAFPGYDTTPRHGKRGVIIDKATPEKFEESFREICQKSIQRKNEYVFINAWNEWGEGNYLEPDTKYGYAFLEAVHKVLTEPEIEHASEERFDKDMKLFYQVFKKKEQERKKFQSFFRVMDQWMKCMEDEKEISSFFLENNYHKAAIYGMGMLGKHLFRQIKQKISVTYFIDRAATLKDFEIPIYNLDEEFPDVDVIVVTIVNEFEDITSKLQGKTRAKIISLTDVVKGIN